jgi:hypothetical protein
MGAYLTRAVVDIDNFHGPIVWNRLPALPRLAERDQRGPCSEIE